MDNIKSICLFHYAQCDIEILENVRETFANFAPIFKNINVGRDDFGPILKEYAKNEGISTQPRRMLRSSYFLENGTIVTPLLLFYLDMGLVCGKYVCILEQTPMKCFNNLAQYAVNARRERDENPNSSVVAEIMKLLAKQFLLLPDYGSEPKYCDKVSQ